MSRYCYTNDPNGNMQNLISSCVNSYSQPVPGNPGRALDCLNANMACGSPSCPEPPPALPCPGAPAPDTVYAYLNPDGSPAEPPVTSIEVMQEFRKGFEAGVLSVMPICFAVFAVLAIVFLLAHAFKQKGS